MNKVAVTVALLAVYLCMLVSTTQAGSQDSAKSQSTIVIFAFNRPQPFTTDPVDTSGGWTTMMLTVGTTGSICGYALLIPSNGDWIEQVRVGCDCGSECPVVTFPVISDSYRFSTGTASGNITAAGRLFK